MSENLIRPAFTTTRTEEERLNDKRELITVSLNNNEKEQIRALMVVLQQERESTLIKQLCMLGVAFVGNQNPQGLLAGYVKENMRRNKRWGLVEVENK